MVEKKTITAQKSLLRLPDGTYVIPFTNTSGAFEIGDIGQALFVDETKGTRRILNGQLVDINENTKPFLDYLLAVKTQYPQLFVTEEEWQAEYNSSVFGQCSKFVFNYDELNENIISVKLPYILNEYGYQQLKHLGNIPEGRILVKEYVNGANWYRWYSDGWIEQGGRGTSTTDAVTTITYSKAFSNTNYTIATTPYSTTNTFNKGSGDWMVAKANGSFNWHSDTYGGWVEYIAIGYTSKPTRADFDKKLTESLYFIQIAHEHYTPQLVRNNLSTINPYTLFDYKYSYNPLNNASWLVSVKQQNPRQTYTSAYEALCVELNDAIQTNETVNLPSGGRYTKHLQTLYYDQSKLTLVGSPNITLNGLLSNANESNHVKLNVNTAISNATSYTLKLRFQFITDSTIVSTSTAVTPNALLIRTVGDKVQTQISLSNVEWKYTLETANTFIEGNWYDLKLSFNNTNGYTFEISDDLGATYTTEWFLREESTRLTPESNFLLFGASYNLPGVPIDLKTIQFTYDGITISCNRQENLVWDSREHTPTEANYDKKFIVDRVNETFRLPLKVDRELNNGEELYFYIGDVAQNSALIDIGRITEQLARLQAEVEKLKG